MELKFVGELGELGKMDFDGDFGILTDGIFGILADGDFGILADGDFGILSDGDFDDFGGFNEETFDKFWDILLLLKTFVLFVLFVLLVLLVDEFKALCILLKVFWIKAIIN